MAQLSCKVRLLSTRHLAVEEISNVPRVAQQVLCNGRRLWRFGVEFLGRGRPVEGQVNDAAWLLDLCQRLQGSTQDGRLALAVARLSQLVAQRLLDGRQPRHAYGGRQVRDAGQGDGADARCFDLSLYQSNGPAADWSARDQYDGVYAILPHVPDHGRHALLQQHLGLQDIAHEGIVMGRRMPDLAILL